MYEQPTQVFTINLYGKFYFVNIRNTKKQKTVLINPFHATGLFLFPLKTSGNQRFSDVFRGYKKRSVALNGLRSKIETKQAKSKYNET